MNSESYVMSPDEIEKIKKLKEALYPESKYPEGIPKSRAERRRAERAAAKPGRMYTDEQIAEIRAEARRSYVKEVQAEYERLLYADRKRLDEYKEKLDKQSEEYFNQLRKKYHSGDTTDEYVSHLIAFMSIAAAVLVEDFKWKPLHGNGVDNNMNMMKFLNGCTRRINDIGADPCMDIDMYCKEIANKYCVGLVDNFEEVINDRD